MNNEELLKVVGGTLTSNATFINATARLIERLFELGQVVGSVIRRLLNKNVCKL